MSINDVPEIREIFSGFDLLEVKTRYTVGVKSNQKQASELLISNYELPRL
jgi:DNA adenine methylase